ncbi:hypothetical protein [Mongoliitalea daihaiensis]|uniref:hypothetical protein n=1 Tax=Mongoliitalea daihaiensis TaxID=2782006 RepID=UPI001F3D5B01|nr:hypothetical protein [Mongoliitalea daihaiensis]UJP64119.1 hypothetical protein IPZ59_15045 [Mongoliitalea daihaiensis]
MKFSRLEMKWKVLLMAFIGVVGVHSTTLAQTPVQEYTYDVSRSFRLNPISVGIKGTPFLFERAALGTIVLSKGKVYEDIPFNINLDKGELFIQTEGVDSDPFLVRNWERVETVDSSPRIFTKERIGLKQEITEELWKDEGRKIVAVHRKTFIQPYVQRDGYSGPQYDEFRYDISYFQLEGMQSKEIKTTKSGLKTFAGSKDKAVQDLIKQERLKVEQPADFKRIVTFILQEN